MIKLLNNIFLATCSFFFVTFGQFIFYYDRPQNAPDIPLEKYIVLFFILFLFSFIKRKLLRLTSLFFLPLLSTFQWIHISYYGTRIFPHEIWLFFSEFSEITGTLKEESFHILFPLAITLCAAVILTVLNNKKDKNLFKLPFMSFIFVFYLAYNPLRTYLTGNNWGRQPSIEEFDGVNTYLSFSYFLGKILPSKLLKKKKTHEANSAQSISGVYSLPLETNIIFILGESLTPNHMSLFGYHKKTTPYLDSLKSDKNFIYKKAISSGVSTDISIAFLFNNSYSLEGTKHIYSAQQCLFKIAKHNNRQTFFFSTQSNQQLRYIRPSICSGSIDHFKSLEDLAPQTSDPNAADDMHLVRALKETELNTLQLKFMTLHMRGSHSPFNLRYPKAFARFTEYNSPSSKRVEHYDNSVLYFDHFMRKTIEYIKDLDAPVLLIYLSDHGEALGEEGQWGHGLLNKMSYTTPLLIYKHKLNNLDIKLPAITTHFNVSSLISKILGFNLNIPYSEQLPTYEVLGNDINGFAGRMILNLENGKITQKDIIFE